MKAHCFLFIAFLLQIDILDEKFIQGFLDLAEGLDFKGNETEKCISQVETLFTDFELLEEGL